jgi:hypothetical protein
MRFLDYFDNFYKSKRLYKENQAFWRLAIAIWCDDEHLELSAASDDSPILHVVFPTLQKSFRVIQRQKNAGYGAFTAWVENIDLQYFTSEELVVSLELKSETYQVVESLFKNFIHKKLSIDEIDSRNAQFQVNW